MVRSRDTIGYGKVYGVVQIDRFNHNVDVIFPRAAVCRSPRNVKFSVALNFLIHISPAVIGVVAATLWLNVYYVLVNGHHK